MMNIYLSIYIYIFVCIHIRLWLAAHCYLSTSPFQTWLNISLICQVWLVAVTRWSIYMGLSEYRVPSPSHFWAYCTLFRFYYPQIGYGYPKIKISMDWSILDIPKKTSPKYHFFHALIMCILFFLCPHFYWWSPAFLIFGRFRYQWKNATLGMPKPYVPWPKLGLPRSGIVIAIDPFRIHIKLPW
jgi:hypothetical protein